jgi:hypothetical protein
MVKHAEGVSLNQPKHKDPPQRYAGYKEEITGSKHAPNI